MHELVEGIQNIQSSHMFNEQALQRVTPQKFGSFPSVVSDRAKRITSFLLSHLSQPIHASLGTSPLM
jgi:hypothetical protein